jgi:shikimate dehydrogenase
MIKCVNGKSQIYGVIGNPVEHTLSPEIQNTFGRRYQHNIMYVPFKVEKDKVKEALDGLWAANVQGFNITVPFKKDVIPHLIEIDEEARRIGAVNCVKRMENGYKGFNTDINGLYQGMLKDDIFIKDENVVILGAGGAGKAVAYLCAREKAASIYVLNRNLDNAQEVVDGVKTYYPEANFKVLSFDQYLQLPEKDLVVIQTTPVGMSTYVEEAVIEDDDFYKRVKAAVDVIYEPYETLFLKKAKSFGAKTMNGLPMLVYQAIISYEIWKDIKIEDEDLIKKIFDDLEKEFNR